MRLRKSSPKRARSGAGRGALVIIAGLLIGSATLRMGSDAGQALARPQDPVNGAGFDSAQTPLACEMPEDFRQMLTAFQARETRIKEQETAIADRLAALQLADQEIDRKMKRLVAAEMQLSETIALADTAAESDIGRLTKVYESMKPKQAAALFEEMSPEFAAGFLGRMRPEAAAGIMAGLSPEAAYGFSVVLAGRNAGAPTE